MELLRKRLHHSAAVAATSPSRAHALLRSSSALHRNFYRYEPLSRGSVAKVVVAADGDREHLTFKALIQEACEHISMPCEEVS